MCCLLYNRQLKKTIFSVVALIVIFILVDRVALAPYWEARNEELSRPDLGANRWFTIGENSPQDKTLNVVLEKCNCERQLDIWEPFPQGWNFSAKDSTCNPSSYARGPSQRILSFSYFDPVEVPELERWNKFGRGYFEGIENNIAKMKELYPRFIMRLYYHIPKEHPDTLERLCELACREPMLDLCEVDLVDNKADSFLESVTGGGKHLQELAMLWRFLPLMDETVDLIFSRDLDSLPSAREISVVSEFLASPKIFHSIRDNPMHNIAVLGGMWGAKVGGARKRFKNAMQRMIKVLPKVSSFNRKHSYDQILMLKYIWSWASHLALSHDAYFCDKYEGIIMPFPTKRLDELYNFVGVVATQAGARIPFTGKKLYICPENCRPKDHLDWTYC